MSDANPANAPTVVLTDSAPAVRPRSATLPWKSYVPLVTLVVLAALLAGLGALSTRGWFDSVAPASTPDACRSDVAAGDPTIWTGPRTADSEAVYAAHTADLTVPIVVGQDGFNFWSDIQTANFSGILGRAPWLDEQRDQWRGYIEDLRDSLKNEGADLLVVVAPSSGTVYPEKLPDWAKPLRGLTQFDQLLAVSGDLPIVDLRGDLIDAAADQWVFSAVNSHWTPYGALVAWNGIVQCIQEIYPESGYEALERSEVVSVELLDPPNEFTEWGVETPRADWAVPTLDPAPRTVSRTILDGTSAEITWPEGIDMLQLPATTTGGVLDKRALIVGDSQSTALSALWAESFGSTVQIRHFLEDPAQRANVLDAARQADADLVILELTERYLSTAAPQVRR